MKPSHLSYKHANMNKTPDHFPVLYFRQTHWRASWREGRQRRGGWKGRQRCGRRASCRTSRTTGEPWSSWTTRTTKYVWSLNDAIILLYENKGNVNTICICQFLLNNLMCVCVPLSVCLQVNPGECNIQKGNRGLPGPPGLQGEVGQKGKDSSCYWWHIYLD